MHATLTSSTPMSSTSWTQSTAASDRILLTPGSPIVGLASSFQREEYYIGTPIKLNLDASFHHNINPRETTRIPSRSSKSSIFERLYEDAAARTARRAEEQRRFFILVNEDERKRSEDVMMTLRESAGKCRDTRNVSLRNLDLLAKRAEWARRGDEARLRREAEEMKECTFHPKILRRSPKRLSTVNAGSKKETLPVPFTVSRTLRRHRDAQLSGIQSTDMH